MKIVTGLAIMLLTIHCGWTQTSVVVLGIAQDGGFPHIGCADQCQKAWDDPALRKNVVALAVTDDSENKWWLFEATPDLVNQLQLFRQLTQNRFPYLPEGIFVTHAHMGHYTGLMQLGREALGAKMIKVYALPQMATFLNSNAPWSQLVDLDNITIKVIAFNETIALSSEFEVIPFQVPHRDELSETAGYRLLSSGKKTLFIPDIDKWEKWDQNIVDMVRQSDRSFIDGSFYAGGELKNRSMSEVPHPFVSETVELFSQEPDSVKSKVFFIHFNHTNPLLWDSDLRMKLISSGYNLAIQGKIYR